jgi:drug/metabolite transporter (DMT)-like permease
MARSQIRLMAPRDQIALGAAGLLVMFAGGWLFWYFAVRPHHPSSYSLFEIAILPVGLLAIGIVCVLAAVAAPPARARSQRATDPRTAGSTGLVRQQ